MALPYPTDPATPSLPNPFFQDNGLVRGDQMRQNNTEIWANSQGLDTDILALKNQALGFGSERLPTIANNGSDATNDIDLTSCRVIDKTFSRMIICSAKTKQSDAVWAAGSGVGWLDEGTVANSSYHIYAILRSDTGASDYLLSLCNQRSGICAITIATPAVATFADNGFQAGQGVVFSTTGALPTGLTAGTRYYVGNISGDTFNLYDTQAHAVTGGATGRVNTSGSQSGVHTVTSDPVLPSGYDYISFRIASIIRSGGAIVLFKNIGRRFDLLVPVNNLNTVFGSSSAVLVVLSVPVGIPVQASHYIQSSEPGDASTNILVTSPYQTDTAPSSTINSLIVNASENSGTNGIVTRSSAVLQTITNRNASIRTRCSASGRDHVQTTHGWVDIIAGGAN